jgi:2-amino-4-hydroxy-6-hydroxymethyldihydropteridine diphosphokinase
MYLIAAGANLPSRAGPPEATIEAAFQALPAWGITLERCSPYYCTPAFPAGSGPDFINAAAVLKTALTPTSVMAALHAIERSMGRVRERRWEPRVCDLDLIACDDLVLPDEATAREWIALDPKHQTEAAPPRLILPHPRLQDRGFVLKPLTDIAPDWVHPVLGRSIAALLEELPDEALAGIEKL